MAKIRVSSNDPSNVSPPPPGYITIFADSTDNNIPKYKTSDNVIHLFGGGTGPGGGANEWKDSVKSIETDPSSLSPSTGDRFLIGSGAILDWLSRDGQLAVWNGSSYDYTLPTDGLTIKIDDDDTAIYHHEGSYSSGVFSWERQPFTNDLLALPTDGSWDDGLFDFEDVLIIDAIDSLNEVVKALAPPPAPDISDWSEKNMIPQEDGALSFDGANPIGGYTPADGGGVPSPVGVDGSFNESGKRLGITDATTGTIGGVINDQVSADSGSPNPAYPADSFGKADKGTLKLYLNGSLIDSIDLAANPGAVDNTGGGSSSGLDISAQFASQFPQGGTLDVFQNRTGEWLVVKSDLNNGYNWVVLEHEVTPTEIITLDRFDLIVDDNTTNTAFSNPLLDALNMTGSKKLSGIDFHTGGTAKYDVDIDNAYRNTWNESGAAISFIGTNCSAPSQPLANSGGDEAKQVNIVDKTVTITPSGIRILNGSIDVQTEVLRTVQPTQQGGLDSIGNILLDNVSSLSNNTLEDFSDESKRMPSDTDFDNYSAFALGMWDGEQSIIDGAAGYVDGLQVIDGKLIYPGNKTPSIPADFTTSNVVNGSTFNDGGTKGSARNYSGASGTRTAYIWFKQVSPTVSNFVMQLTGSGTFVPVTTSLTGDNIHLELRAPSQTGWLDCYQDFQTGQFSDGDGCRNATAGAGRTFGVNWGLTIGTKSTAFTGGYMVLKISMSDTFSGEIDEITFNFG